jgi:hypothetical protein
MAVHAAMAIGGIALLAAEAGEYEWRELSRRRGPRRAFPSALGCLVRSRRGEPVGAQPNLDGPPKGGHYTCPTWAVDLCQIPAAGSVPRD